MQVSCLEQTFADVRLDADWLSPAELARLKQMRVPKRRTDWQLGRWTAKHAVANFLHLQCDPPALQVIEIRPAESGAPEVFLQNRPAPVSISLSHRDGRAVCAIAAADVVLGCDLEIAEPRCDAFVADYFTADEQKVVDQTSGSDRYRMLALLWSAKESTLKALRTGLRMDTRSVAVTAGQCLDAAARTPTSPSTYDWQSPAESWHPLRTVYLNRQVFDGWWQCRRDRIFTMVSLPASDAPVPLATVIELPDYVL